MKCSLRIRQRYCTGRSGATLLAPVRISFFERRLIFLAVLVAAEESAVGDIGFSTYNAYIRAGGGWIVSIFVILLFVISAGTIVFADWWLSQWVTTMTTVKLIVHGFIYFISPSPIIFYNGETSGRYSF